MQLRGRVELAVDGSVELVQQKAMSNFQFETGNNRQSHIRSINVVDLQLNVVLKVEVEDEVEVEGLEVEGGDQEDSTRRRWDSERGREEMREMEGWERRRERTGEQAR